MKRCMRPDARIARHGGTQEVEAGMVTLRDMRTGAQEMLGFEEAVARILG